MVHGIMKDHGGGIFVESTPGAGTTFDLYFPEAKEAGAEAPAPATNLVYGHGESILVIDDEEAICGAIGAMLRRIGYRVETFTDPRQGLVRFRSSPAEFNLLLTDRTMPHLSGPELIAQVHDWWPGLPALLMSGMTGTAPQFASAEQGGYGLVEKPVDIAELSRAVYLALQSPPTT
jgi:two-component system, cell cycle sensor histidine kinase and response regulator CckA